MKRHSLGKKLDPCEILAQIGVGGMREVLKYSGDSLTGT